MNERELARAHGAVRGHAEAHGEAHVVPTSTYLKVGLVLAVITAVEFGIVYVPALKPVLIPLLLILSGAKFALVAGFFMHLKFDRWVLAGFFAAGLILALGTYLGLGAIFAHRGG